VTWKPWHALCQLRQLVGGLNHLRGTCTCCGGTDDPDPPGLSRRNAAIAASVEFARKYGHSHDAPS
jgi:hypothetical protein